MEKSQKQRALKYNPLMRKRADICDNNANFHKTRGSYSTSLYIHTEADIYSETYSSLSIIPLLGLPYMGLQNALSIAMVFHTKYPLIKRRMLQQCKDGTENS